MMTRARRGSHSGSGMLGAASAAPEDAPAIAFSEGDIEVSLMRDWGVKFGAAGRQGKKWHHRLRRWFPWVYAFGHAAMFFVVVWTNALFPPEEVLMNAVGRSLTLLLLAAGGCHLHLSTSDPGYLRTKREHVRGDAGVEGVVLMSPTTTKPARPEKDRHCRYCCVGQPARTIHCQFCNRCVYTYDHHCWWVNRCIGGRNKPLFLLFLFLQTALVAGTTLLQLYSLRALRGVLHGAALFASLAVCAVVLQWNLQLMWIHVRLVMRNVTALEYYRPDRCEWLPRDPEAGGGRRRGNPYGRGVVRNLADFLYHKPVVWEPVRS
eukprot:TRINITY_DN10688_c0_g1_i6.p1 TRINITY_DN10688_c0_g1~~TRINITY_DN10688_c0_g1_i6.p1  ORF type:complete len:350 (+),score=97.23 TRINITY_DN10688_c0_g1_i6:93-1052(+)